MPSRTLSFASFLFIGASCARTPAPPPAPPAPAPVASAPIAPAPPPPAIEVGRPTGPCAQLPDQITPVHFELDSDEVEARYLDTLQDVALCLKAHPDVKLRVEGHADDRGTSEYNLALGDRRARKVETTLDRLGVGPTRVETTSYGEERPAAVGTGEPVWSQNRRAELRLEQE